jgi:putative membrane protein
MWISIVLLVLVLAALVVVIVRLFTLGPPRSSTASAPSSSARQIAEERLARGEISPEEFGHIASALERPS